MKNLDGGFEVKNFSYTCSLFKGNHSMENKIIEYGITLLHKYKIEQTEVIFYSLFSSQILLSWLRYHEFRKYSSNHILKVHKAPNQSVVKNINMFFLRKCKHATFCEAFIKSYDNAFIIKLL